MVFARRFKVDRNSCGLRRIAGGVMLALSLTLSACMVGPNYQRPAVPAPADFEAEPALAREAVSVSWWKSFNDPALLSLVERAIKDNREIDAALARLNQSRALRLESFLDLFPTVTSGAAYIHERQSAARFGDAPVPRRLELYSSGLDASWEIDLFGRVRREVEVRDRQEQAAATRLEDVLRIVIAEVAGTYFELRGTQAELQVARQNAASQEKTLKLTVDLKSAGQSTAFDVARATAQYKATLSSIPAMESRIKSAIYRLAVLTGNAPGALTSELGAAGPLPVYQGPLTIGSPAELLERRPDVRSAENLLAAATAGIGVARGDYYPRITFGGSLGYEATTPQNFNSGSAETWSFGPRLSWAAFDLGRVYARVKAADASAAEALAAYQQAVLLALEDTQNALTRFSTERERRNLLKEAATESTRAFELADWQYRQGAIDFLSVLEAQRQMLLTQIELARSETALALNLIGIFKALGGGWEEVVVAENPEKS